MANGKRHDLDDISKAIIAQLQQDGRRSYASIGKAVGLSEAAVRQRVQRLTGDGVMQIVAVTDPLQLGFARQAMVGIRVTGALEPVADALSEISEVDYIVLTAGSYDLLAEVVCESDEHLLRDHLPRDPRHPGRRRHRDPRLPQAAQADVLVGRALSAQQSYDALSYWHDSAGEDWTPRPPLPGDLDVDVAVVGAGYTGLWTAYYLAEADPSLSVAVLESEVAGFGASGRNGGWCSALFPAELPALAALGSREAALAQHEAMRATRRRGRPGRPGRGHRRARRQGRDDPAGPRRRPARAGPGRGRGGAALGPGRGRPGAPRRRGGDARSCAPTASRARRTPPTARPSIRRDWCAGWPGRPNAAA